MYKEERGVTLIALVITIIVLVISLSIVINAGIKNIKEVQMESIKTNMLLIQAKGKEYVEDTKFHIIGASNEEEIKSQYLKGTPIEGTDDIPTGVTLSTNQKAYKLDENDMTEMGLNNIEKIEDYIIVYNIEDEEVDVIYKAGIKKDDKTYYTLSSMEDIESELTEE